jgi:superfamily II DNA or RNA helicase
VSLDPGLYERLVSQALAEALSASDSIRSKLDAVDAPRRIGAYLGEAVERAVRSVPEHVRVSVALELANAVVDALSARLSTGVLGRGDHLVAPGEILTAVTASALGSQAVRPLTPLADTVLFTNAKGEPAIGVELGRELASADRVDALVAFVKWSGLRQIEAELREYLQTGRPMRLITTTYTGATERTALDRLVQMGAEVKIAYDNRSTRLHAKAWLFRRNTGFDTAWIGSSNLSKAALVDGLEWNVRASAVSTPDVIAKFAGTFDAYWSDPDFESYDPATDRDRFDSAVNADANTGTPLDLSFLDVRPYGYQQDMLDRLDAERKRHDRWHNLVVAATGTGKTVVAALDYRRLTSELGDLKLLFVAHRKEILEQSRSTFRAVMRDGSFGEDYVDGARRERWRHVFASIQSLSAGRAVEIDPTHFDMVIVDEFHHAEAGTYKALLNHLEPQILLGLTATPERADGQSILGWFDNRIAVEMRLWDALERDLLVPFHYFGVHDDTTLETLSWNRGGYQVSDLDNLYTGNDARVAIVLQALTDKVADVSAIKALGFCVSVAHARYMAQRFNQAGIRSVAVTADTSSVDRKNALVDLQKGNVNVVFAVDLFNEGVDVRAIDTLLFLRPTESATVFLQQLGRGLRRDDGKSVLTVLDFVGHQHRRFRFDLRYRALTGDSRKRLQRQVEDGFPYLPSGCHIELDPVARKLVLDNIRNSLPNRWKQRVAELRTLGDVGLSSFLAETGLELEDVYQGGHSWTEHRRAAGIDMTTEGKWDKALGGSFARMLHIEDDLRLDTYRHIIHDGVESLDRLDEPQRRLAFMLHLSLWNNEKFDRLAEGFERFERSGSLRRELLEVLDLLAEQAQHVHRPLTIDPRVPLRVHARYTRSEILAALGRGSPSKPPTSREGVLFDRGANADLFFVTLEKNERDFSPSTRYQD